MLTVRTPREFVEDENIKINFTGWENLCENNVNLLKYVPGIYEIAVFNPKVDKQIVAYVGFTSKLKERLQTHCLGVIKSEFGHKCTSPILLQVKTARSNGWDVFFRVFEMKTKDIAKIRESFLLSQYDYCWNQAENFKKREVDFGMTERHYWIQRITDLESRLCRRSVWIPRNPRIPFKRKLSTKK